MSTMSLNSGFPSGAMLIADEWVSDTSEGAYEHIYPATGKPNAIVAMAGAEEIDRAVTAAWKAQADWVRMSVDSRRDLLLKLADMVEAKSDELTRLAIHDNAVPYAQSAYQPSTLIRFIRYYAGWIDKGHGSSTPVSMSADLNFIEREPYGVVGIIVPWNGPLFVTGMSVVPALAAGNAVVLKPPELAPLAALRFGELCLEAGLPPGLVSVVPGGPAGGDALVRHPGIRKIHFTGSGDTARKILVAASENLTPVATELGGKAANIVFDDADLDQAATLAAFSGVLVQSGQTCACSSRILVQEKVYDEFVQRFLGVIERAKVGDPLDPNTVVGPVISESAANRILGLIGDARSEHMGELLVGGSRIGGGLSEGYFIEPTVFANVDNKSPIAQVEIFGPVASLIPFKTEEEAIALANDTVFGLVDYVNTTDLARAHRVARQLQAGALWVNQTSDIVPNAPYGGYKQSGVGRGGGLEGLQEFQQVKNIRIGMPGAESLHFAHNA